MLKVNTSASGLQYSTPSNMCSKKSIDVYTFWLEDL